MTRRNMTKPTRLTIAFLTGLLLPLTGCSSPKTTAPQVDSDSAQNYKGTKRIPVDLAVYDITGEVAAEVKSLTRQVNAGGGSIAGYNGYTSGSFFGPVTDGKGYVRLTVGSIKPATDLAREGQTILLKVTDTKATALLPGDFVAFRCRRQYEALAAVQNNDVFNTDAVATWEFDFCRLRYPGISK